MASPVPAAPNSNSNTDLARQASIDKKEDAHVANIVAGDNSLGLFQAVKVYPRATMYSALGAMTAVSDGFQYNLPGNILALPGFINQFGVWDAATGRRAVPAQHISIWGGE